MKFGISPFGIWRPGNPPQIQGYDQYAMLYADAKKWFNEGWVDYFTPQLYWPIAQKPQSYPVLLQWWAEQNSHGRHLWPGNYTSRVGDGSATAWPATEIANQIETTRGQPGATGNIHFSMKALMENRGGIGTPVLAALYREPALVPASPWLGGRTPQAPRVELRHGSERAVSWKLAGRETPFLWVVQTHSGSTWTTRILPAAQTTQTLPSGVDAVAVSAVDRSGRQGPIRLLPLGRH